MFERILIPTDGSDSVEPAIQHGLNIADKYDATIHALHVLNTTALERKLDLTALPDESEVPDAWSETGDEITDNVANRSDELGLETVMGVRRGIPVREILTYIDDHDIDLIAMGTHGRSGTSRRIIGSVTERMLRTTLCPVLTVRP